MATPINFVVLDNISSMTDEVFTFQPKNKEGEKSGAPLFFNATKLRMCVTRQGKKYLKKVSVQQSNYDAIIKQGGVEPHKLNRLAERPDIMIEPVIFCHYPDDDSHILVDGNHRMVLLFQMGFRDLPAYIVPKDVWQDFLIPFPEDLAEVFLND